MMTPKVSRATTSQRAFAPTRSDLAAVSLGGVAMALVFIFDLQTWPMGRAQFGIQGVLDGRDTDNHQLEIGRAVVDEGVRLAEQDRNAIALMYWLCFAVHLNLA